MLARFFLKSFVITVAVLSSAWIQVRSVAQEIENKGVTLPNMHFLGPNIRPDSPESLKELDRINAIFKKLRELYVDGTPKQILDVCMEGLAIWTNDEQFLFYAALAYESLKDPQSEIVALRRAVYSMNDGGQGPDKYVRMKLIECLLKNREWEEAAILFKKGEVDQDLQTYLPKNTRGFDPRYPEYSRLGYVAHYLMGVTRPHFGSMPEKSHIDHLEMAIRLMPGELEGHVRLAYRYRPAGKYAEARTEYQKVANLSTGKEKAEALSEASYMTFTINHPVAPKVNVDTKAAKIP